MDNSNASNPNTNTNSLNKLDDSNMSDYSKKQFMNSGEKQDQY